MIVTGTIVIDITKVAEKSQRGRIVAALGDAPSGAHVGLLVGQLVVGGDALRTIRRYAQERGLTICVQGESCRAIKSWVDALNTGEVCGYLL